MPTTGKSYATKQYMHRGYYAMPAGGYGNRSDKSKTAAGRPAKKGNTGSKFTY